MSPDETSPPEENSAEAALAWATREGVVAPLCGAVERRLRRRRIRNRTLAALGLAAVLPLPALWLLRDPDAANLAEVPRAEAIVSVPERLSLPDGTLVELNGDARLTVDFDGPGRRVVLLGGEAHFAVARDPLRPFVVEAAGIEVRAVGTAFAVQHGASAIEVIVTEGRVAVRAAPTGVGERSVTEAVAFVDSGSRCVVPLPAADAPAEPPRVASVGPREIAERLAWRVPRLEFSGTPLGRAIPLFNEHAGVRLVLDDPALGGLQLSGVVRADNTDSLLRLLRAEFGIAATERGGEIVLHEAR